MKPLPFWRWLFWSAAAYLIFNWLAPIFAKPGNGQLENGQKQGIAPRLPRWLNYFDTPDNGLTGDTAFKLTHPRGTYWDMVCWLYRNTLYGYQCSVLAAPVKGIPRLITGNKDINYHTSTFGTLDITCGEYWQHKEVTQLKWFPQYCKVINKGWMLDNLDVESPMFVYSFRYRKHGA